MLKTVQRARRGVGFKMREGVHRHELAFRAFDIGALELVGVQTRAAPELRNDLVAAAREIEAVHIIAADEGGEVGADGLQIEAEHGDFFAVNHEFHFGLVNFRVNDRREGEQAAGRGFLLQNLCELQYLIRLDGGGQNKFHRELAAAGQCRRHDHVQLNARDAIHHRLHLRLNLEHGAFPLAPRLQHHAAETGAGKSELKRVRRLRNLLKQFAHGFRVERGLLNRGIRRSFDDAKHHALIFRGRQFFSFPGHHEHWNRQ